MCSWSHTYVEIAYSHSPPSIDSRRIVVSYKRKYAHELSQACQRKSMVCKTDRLNMNKAFDWDVKNQIQQADKATQISTLNLIWVTSRENSDFVACVHQGCRPACEFAQSGQRLCNWPYEKNNNYTYSMQNFNLLACLCSWAGSNGSYMVTHPKNQAMKPISQ